MAWVGWSFSDSGWQCPHENRFRWNEAEYFRVKEEDLEVVEAPGSTIKVGILREARGKTRPVLVGPSDPCESGYIWVTDVGSSEWVAIGGKRDKRWARPVTITNRKRRMKTA